MRLGAIGTGQRQRILVRPGVKFRQQFTLFDAGPFVEQQPGQPPRLTESQFDLADIDVAVQQQRPGSGR